MHNLSLSKILQKNSSNFRYSVPGGKTMKKLIALLFTCSIGVSTLPTYAQVNDAFKKKVVEVYPKTDTDGDGVLSHAEEAAVTRRILKRFPNVDQDGDGVLSSKEKQTLLRMAANRAKRTADQDIPEAASPIAAQDLTESLTAIMDRAVQQQQIAGCSFLVIHKGKTIFRKACGYADIESKRLFTTDELVPIASVSKPFLASLLMVLVEQGKLQLDDPVEKYLPEFKEVKVNGSRSPAKPMTVRQLLSHTGGFWGNKGISREKLDLIRNFQRPLAAAVIGIAEYDLVYEPGTKFLYSGSGYCVAGRVAEVALGQSLEEIAQAALFRPLGLNRTTYLPSKKIRKTVPTAYLRQGEKLQKQPSRTQRELRFILPGGSLFTTMDEMAVFAQMHLNDGVHNGKRILSPSSIAEMRRLQSPDREARTYGLGWFRDDVSESGLADLVFHGGAMGAHLRVDRSRELVCVFLVHQTAVQVAELKNGLVQQVDKMLPVPNDP